MAKCLIGTGRWRCWDWVRAYSMGTQGKTWITPGYEEVWSRTTGKHQRTCVYRENTLAKAQDHEICKHCCLIYYFSLSLPLPSSPFTLPLHSTTRRSYIFYVQSYRCTRYHLKGRTSLLPSKLNSCFPVLRNSSSFTMASVQTSRRGWLQFRMKFARILLMCYFKE